MESVRNIAIEVMKKRYQVTHKDLNAINSRVLENGLPLEAVVDETDRHIAETIAEENLRQTTTSVLERRINSLEVKLTKSQDDRISRSKRGRTPGAGAGGFNRDLERISHRIDIYRLEIQDLKNELYRREHNNLA